MAMPRRQVVKCTVLMQNSRWIAGESIAEFLHGLRRIKQTESWRLLSGRGVSLEFKMRDLTSQTACLPHKSEVRTAYCAIGRDKEVVGPMASKKKVNHHAVF